MSNSAVVQINFSDSGEIVCVEVARPRRHNRFFMYHPTRTSMRRLLLVAYNHNAVFKPRPAKFSGEQPTVARPWYLESIFDVKVQ